MYPSRKKIGAVLLAAGSGSRMGHRPKSLLELNGEPLVCRQLHALAAAGVAEVVLVLGHYAGPIEEALAAVKDCAFARVRNPDPEAGQISSLRLGLQALPQDIGVVLVALADQPLIDAEDIRALIQAYEDRPAGTQFVQPTVHGLPGNPVLFSAEVRAQILVAGSHVGGQQWKSAHPGQVHLWASTNDHYRLDVDTPEDVASLIGLGHRLNWPADVQPPG